MTLPESLAALNACLNGTSAVLMTLAFRAVKRGDVERHKKLMLSAVGVSAVFLTSYVTRMAIAGDTHFQGEGVIRYVYFAILITHVLLAMVVVPLVLRTVYLGLKDQRPKHRKIAKYAFPVWLYVSVTGVVVYLMLYQLY